MKLRLLILSLLIINSSLLISQDTWVQSYAPFGSSEDKDYSVRNIAVCQDGGYAVNGSFRYEVDEYYVIEYGFLMKTDSNGNYLWAKKDTVTFIEKTESYAFVETDDCGFISATTNASFGGGNALIKRDSEGSREWVIDNDGFQVWSMVRTSDGNIVLSGILNMSLPALRKITQAGTEVWTQTYSPNRETGRLFSIIETSDGGLASTGYIQGNNLDIYILKTDSAGDTLWTRTYDGYGDSDLGYCIIETNNNNFMVCGSYEDFIPSHNIFLYLTNDGETIWEHYFEEFHKAYSVIQTHDNNFVSGDSELIFKFDSDYDLIWTGESGSGASGGDKCIKQLDNDGFLTCNSTLLSSYIWLKKSNEIGYLTANDEVIFITNETTFSAYPNPFNPIVSFELKLKDFKDLEMNIYNAKGQLIEMIPITSSVFHWDAEDNASGIYFCKLLRDNEALEIKKITLMK